jgi:hypothetical protein
MVPHVALKAGPVVVVPAAPTVAGRDYFRWIPIDGNAALGRAARAAMVAYNVDNGVVA